MKNITTTFFTILLCFYSTFSYSQTKYIEILCTNETVQDTMYFKIKPINGIQGTYSYYGKMFIQFYEDQIVMTEKESKTIFEFDLEGNKSLYVNGKIRPNVTCEYRNLELINKLILKEKFKPSFANQSNEEIKKLKIEIKNKTKLVINLENKLKKLNKKISEENKNSKVCPKSKNITWDNCFGIDVSEKGKYEGFFKNGKKDGLGTFAFKNGHKYIGEFKQNKIDGLGTGYFANGQKYVGEWKDNEINGLGTKYYPDGRIEKGEYKSYELSGFGITYNADGTVDKLGIWKDGNFQVAENNKMNANQNVTVNSKTPNDSILIELIKTIDLKNFINGDTCSLEYKITNNSRGTLYKIAVGIDGWDDRNTKYDKVLGFRIDNNNGGFGYTRIPKGGSGIFSAGSFKGTCKYLDRLKFDKIDPDDCNIRLLSEEDDCNKIVKIIPGQTRLKIN